jgi:hypothetical protein
MSTVEQAEKAVEIFHRSVSTDYIG